MDGRGRFKDSIHTCASKFVTLPGAHNKNAFSPEDEKAFSAL